MPARERVRSEALEKWGELHVPDELAWWRGLRDDDLEGDLDREDDHEQERYPPVATARAQPNDRYPERHHADDLALAQHRDDRGGEIEPPEMRELHRVEDDAVEALERVRGHEDREGNERGKRRDPAR